MAVDASASGDTAGLRELLSRSDAFVSLAAAERFGAWAAEEGNGRVELLEAVILAVREFTPAVSTSGVVEPHDEFVVIVRRHGGAQRAFVDFHELLDLPGAEAAERLAEQVAAVLAPLLP